MTQLTTDAHEPIKALASITPAEIAAFAAVAASLAAIFANVYYGRKSIQEQQYRDLIKPYITDLGEELHQVLAFSKSAANRMRDGDNFNDFIGKARDASKRLDLLRRQVKYPLGTISDGTRELVDLPRRLKHMANDTKRRDDLLVKGDALRVSLDDAIRESFLRGREPTQKSKRKVAIATNEFHEVWARGMTACDDELDNDASRAFLAVD